MGPCPVGPEAATGRPIMTTALVDCHMHSTYSDGSGTIEQNARAAADKGFAIIACTDHLATIDYMDCTIDLDRIPEYLAEIEAVQNRYPTLRIVAGFEADWYEGCENALEPLLKNVPYVLGSVHYLDEYAIDWAGDMRIWDLMSPDEIWKRYVEDWCRACACPFRFSSMAHPDLIKYMASGPRAPQIPASRYWDDMVEAAKSNDVFVEINTAAMRKGLGSMYPDQGLLRRFCSAGVPITIGSDAHDAHDVGAGIADAYAYAYEAGYRRFSAPWGDGDWVVYEL